MVRFLSLAHLLKKIMAFIYIRLFLTILNIVLRLEVPSLYKMQLCPWPSLVSIIKWTFVISKTKILFWCNSLLVFRLFLLILKMWSILSIQPCLVELYARFCLYVCVCVPLDVLLWHVKLRCEYELQFLDMFYFCNTMLNI